MTLPEIGALYDRAPGSVWCWLRKAGIPTRSTREAAALKVSAVLDPEIDEMVRLHRGGLSSNQIAARLERDGRLVRTHLEARGELRDHAAAMEHYFATLPPPTWREDFFAAWSPAMAWVLGLIFGDGHVMNRPDIGQYGVSLAGTRDVCQAVADLLGLAVSPRKAKGVRCWILQWYSKPLVRSLRPYGLVGGAKATTMRFPEVPSEMLPHFIRGLWDSDGSWIRSAMYACSSRLFIDALAAVLLARGWVGRLSTHNKILKGKPFTGFQLRYRVGPSRELAEWLYAPSTPALRCVRKFGVALRGVGGPWR